MKRRRIPYSAFRDRREMHHDFFNTVRFAFGLGRGLKRRGRSIYQLQQAFYSEMYDERDTQPSSLLYIHHFGRRRDA